jgi:RecA/RadA recombinase
MSVGTKAEMKVRRLSTGVKGFDELIGGGIPEGFFCCFSWRAWDW